MPDPETFPKQRSDGGALTTVACDRAQRNRGSLFLEEGELLRSNEYAGQQQIMRIRAPKCAAAAKPGSFVHVHCNDALPMRRPLSIMRACDDWIEVLFKTAGGAGLHLLADRLPGNKISVLGPIGVPFCPQPERPNALLIGGGVGIPPMVFLADRLRDDKNWQPLAILGSEIPFPFEPIMSSLPSPWLQDDAAVAMPLLEDWGIPCRLTSLSDFAGCFRGCVTDLAELWLQSLSRAELAQTEIFCCGPTPMLKASAELAAKHDLPCQASLEEFMACAVGGCAGCTVEVMTADGSAMKRVCVDGPVFDAHSVVW